MPSVVSKTSHNDAKPAVTAEKLQLADPGSTSLQYVQTAVTRRKFRLSRKPTDLYTAATASQKQKTNNLGVHTMAQITEDTIIADILKIAPESVPLFRSVGMNCLGCAMASGETLGQACAAHGVEVDDLLSKLSEYLEQ